MTNTARHEYNHHTLGGNHKDIDCTRVLVIEWTVYKGLKKKIPAFLLPTPDADAEVAEVKEECVTSVFIPAIEGAVAEYVAKWQERDESDNFGQRYDGELVKDELRPLVFEEIRQQVWTVLDRLCKFWGVHDGILW